MYLNKALDKINNIKWNEVGTIISKEDADLGREFLRRVAGFYKEESIKPMKPMFTHIAKLLGDTEEEVEISKYCSSLVLETIVKNTSAKRIFEFYIQLSKYVDKNSEYEKYLNVYEPLIRIFERGGSFIFRMHELEIENVAYISMNEWYDRFVEMEPINIEGM
ncbi:hypothetical protein SAMN04487969_1276 [Paenibacillus algorifonticola]|uniref:Uncharacterized protein n=1 Tax=Paenibacillus algorifonticola TaxID=684063 RepID=A0A1I2HXN1_9BACL|nr:hypothetical protein [Paenibacillus algorifonticola]SFF33376.1 hypothetical protein SAMN04487969_1276 [Paenibacillus algorifonticola]